MLQIAAALFPRILPPVRNHTLLSLLIVLLYSYSASATDRIYTLVPDTPFDGSLFGFSGTITTDGSTGAFFGCELH